ncbi:protein arginine kinase [Megamonas funiformis]
MPKFTTPQLSWLTTLGKEADIVLASRVRLARNLKNLPFPNRANINDLAQIKELIIRLIPAIESATGLKFDYLEIDKLTHLEQQVLVEKHLISKKLLTNPENRLLILSTDASVAIMVNEDDHLRIQCMASGLDLNTPLAKAFAIDDAIEAYLNIAFDEKMGYLTACPTNLGTGLRASVLLHLPALVMTQQLSKIVNISPQLGLAIRNFFGEDNAGNIFQIDNQLTLGFKEQELIDNLNSTVTEIISHEREARKALLNYSPDKLANRVWRSFGILKYARFISENEMLDLVSKVRLGVDLDIIDETKPELLNILLIASQKNYIQNLQQNENMTPQEIDKQRAHIIRKILQELAPDISMS